MRAIITMTIGGGVIRIGIMTAGGIGIMITTVTMTATVIGTMIMIDGENSRVLGERSGARRGALSLIAHAKFAADQYSWRGRIALARMQARCPRRARESGGEA